jgi:hypothetical protein
VASTQALRHVQVPASGVRTAARAITTVTSIFRDGTLRQHAAGKNSRDIRPWEKSMRFKNQLPGGPSLHGFAPHGAEQTITPTLRVANAGVTRAGQSTAMGQRLRSHLEIVHRVEADHRIASCDDGIRTVSERDASRSSILAERFRVVMKAIGGFAARGEAAFESVLLAAMSWTVAQVLAGCAEYCQAIYPTFVELDGPPVDEHDATNAAQFDRRVANQPGSREIGARARMGRSHQPRLGATAIVHADAVRVETAHIEAIQVQGLARAELERTFARRWSASITAPVAEFWLRLRHERERRRAIMELRALERRISSDAALSQTEYFASHNQPRLGEPSLGVPSLGVPNVGKQRFGDHCE